MIVGWIVVMAAAILDWMAVAKGWKKIETYAKPGTMVALFLMLVLGLLKSQPGSVPLTLFGLGILFSLAGDIFLLVSYARFSNRWFLLGLAAFLLAHVSYIIGLNTPPPSVPLIWSLGLSAILALTAARILRRIVIGVREKGLNRMVFPVVAYGVVITVMLLSALLTLYRSDWRTGPAGLVVLGAALFYLSDVILAWNRYVTPIKNGRVINMMAYHLGQFALVAGVLAQFAR